jgi:hypothetical protein
MGRMGNSDVAWGQSDWGLVTRDWDVVLDIGYCVYRRLAVRHLPFP